jgi:Tol biopolymer transport system component
MDPMTGMGPIVRRAVLAIAAGFVICLPMQPAAADSAAGHQLRFSIAASDASDSPPAGGPSWPEMSQIIAAEMTASGRFLQIEPSSPIAEPVSAVPQFGKWRSIDTDVLITGRIMPASNGRWKAEFRLWDMASGKLLLAQQYMLDPEEPRPVPRLMAAAIKERFGR